MRLGVSWRRWAGWVRALAAVTTAAAAAVCANPAWAAHAYAQFGDIKYPAGFDHFDYVNPKAPKGGNFSLVAPTQASSFDKYNPFTLKGTQPPGLETLVFETLLGGNFDEPATADSAKSSSARKPFFDLPAARAGRLNGIVSIA